MPLNLRIIDSDIAEVSQYLENCHFDDPERTAVIKCIVSRDVQACPGSGKTTLLVAKLAILSKKWIWRDRGICVLSHTNVAKHQIESKLSRHPTAHKLLSYPHFIGTIQSFVDQYLGLPFLRIRDAEVSFIDNERFKEKAIRLLPYYRKAYARLRHRHNYKDIVAGLKFVFENNMLKLKSAHGQLDRENTATYTQLFALKKALLRDGILRFDDMYAFAESYISSYPFIIDFLRFRFPWTFIDEMQDTNSTQDSLLQKIFCENSIYQRFGDINQAIFGDGAEDEIPSSFPFADYLEMSDSLRCGPNIARLSCPLTIVQQQTFNGNIEHEQKRHTIILFDERTISEVLRSFAELIKAEYTILPDDFVAKAVGFVRSAADTPEQLPHGIKDYWQDFQPDFTSKTIRPSHFIDFSRLARDMLEREKECKAAYDLILEGIFRFLRHQDATDEEGKRFTKTRLLDSLILKNILPEFQNFLYGLLFSLEQSSPATWETIVDRFTTLLVPLIGREHTQAANRFLEWTEECGATGHCTPEHIPNRINVFHHEGVKIDLATIHSVKGETHNATLVLETFWYVHDLKEILPFLKGQRHSVSNINQKKRIKNIFVGMTRPKELLCLAMRKNHLEDGDADTLSAIGWNIQDITRR